MTAKPLNWIEPITHQLHAYAAAELIADGIGGKYQIYRGQLARGFKLYVPEIEFTPYVTQQSVEECKAIAEAHWQAAYKELSA